MRVLVRLDSYRGRVIACLDFTGTDSEKTAAVTSGVIGKHAVYFEFLSDEAGEIASFDRFTFS